MKILGLQKLSLLDYPGKIACTTAFPKIGEGGPHGVPRNERSRVLGGSRLAVDEDDSSFSSGLFVEGNES